MKATEQTLQQLERALRKVADKFPSEEEATQMTDLHIRVSQESGELTVFDDDENEVTRCIIEQWINNQEDDFYNKAATTLRSVINKDKNQVEKMSILKPFSLVLEDDERETIAELYLVDDEMVIINPDLMEGLDEDLNNFLDNLFKD